MKNKQIVLFGATLALVLALVFWFAMPAMNYTLFTKHDITFMNATFATPLSIAGFTLGELKFSILNLVPFLLLVLALILLILKVLDIKLFANKNFDTVLITLFSVLSGIGFLLVIVFTGMTNDVDMDGFTLGMGAILAGALSIVGGLLTFASNKVK
ncbi:MAG TPA: hypothetical protein GX012_00400 [Acholeplasma sp.]|nr:hypothetical protein [Acholeplasma sp.]